MENTTTQFNERVQIIFQALQKGIPEKEILWEYNSKWDMPVTIMQSYFDEAKKLLAPPPPEGGIEGKDEVIGTDGNMQSVMPSPLGEGKDRANLHNITPPPLGGGRVKVIEAETQPVTPPLMERSACPDYSGGGVDKANSETLHSSPLNPSKPNSLIKYFQVAEPKPPRMKEKSTWKVPTREFIELLRQNNGNFSETAKAITKKYDYPYTRQAVRDRAKKFPALIADIKGEFTDLAQANIFKYLKEETDKKLCYRASAFVVQNSLKGKFMSSENPVKEVYKINNITEAFDGTK